MIWQTLAFRLKTPFTKSSLRWTHGKMSWRNVSALWRRSWLYFRRPSKLCLRPFHATCRPLSIMCRSAALPAAGRSRHRRKATAPSYNDDSSFCIRNRPTAASAEGPVVQLILQQQQQQEMGVVVSRIRDPRPERGQPLLPRERPHQRPCPYLRNHLSHRRCHPSPNSVNSVSLYLPVRLDEKSHPLSSNSQYVFYIHIKIYIYIKCKHIIIDVT